jgi:spore germination protein KA
MMDNQDLFEELALNVQMFKNIFENDDTFTIRYVRNIRRSDLECCLLLIDGMVKKEIVEEAIVKPIIKGTVTSRFANIIEYLEESLVAASRVEKAKNVKRLVKAIVRGDAVLLAEGASEALIVDSKGWKSRPITEPESEKVIRGPREGFTEPLLINLSLIRRKLETPNLKFKFMTLGVQTQTKICVCYLEGIVNPGILKELYGRLQNIHMDSILDSGYIQEMICDSPLSPFKTVGSTERPDVVAGKILEGRVAVLVDGTPVALTVPHLFIEDFQANEDYYINFYYSSIGRMLRILGFIISISIPAVYVALLTFHQEMVPTPLLLSISAARQGVPFPTIVETILLLLIFEILRETGIRMPSNIGQALSIVGALVLGQASVEAKIVSASVVIVVATTGITGLMIPKIKSVTIIMRGILLLLSAFIGLYGFTFGIVCILLHLCQLRSFGVPYLTPVISYDPESYVDTAIRMPWWYMKFRPEFLAGKNFIRQSTERKKT